MVFLLKKKTCCGLSNTVDVASSPYVIELDTQLTTDVRHYPHDVRNLQHSAHYVELGYRTTELHQTFDDCLEGQLLLTLDVQSVKKVKLTRGVDFHLIEQVGEVIALYPC